MLCDCTKRSVSQLTRLLFHGRRNLHPENVPRKLFLRFLTTSPASAQEVQKTLVDQPAIPGYDHVPPAKLLPISAAFPTAKKIAGNSRKLKRVPFLAVSNEEKILTIREGNKSTEIPLLWLRDSCTCEKCVNQGAYQRNSWTVITNAQIEKAEVNNGFIHATWTDGHESHHDLSIIKQMLRKPDSSQVIDFSKNAVSSILRYSRWFFSTTMSKLSTKIGTSMWMSRCFAFWSTSDFCYTG